MASEGALEPAARFEVRPGDEVAGHAVAPDLSRVVYATQHVVVCLGRDGGEVWRYDLLPRSNEKYGHWPGCEFSLDGKTVWVYRPDGMANRADQDRWVVLSADSGEVIAQAELGTVGHGGEHHRHPNGVDILLDVGEGQDGVHIFRGVGDGLELLKYPWEDRCLIDLAPDGRQFMTVYHDQSDVAFHSYPSGDVILELSMEVFGHDPEEIFFQWSGGYLDADTAIVTVGGETEDEEEWHRHYRVDLRTGGVLGAFDAHSESAYDIEPLGDGTWLTSGSGSHPVRWTR
ncbi:hypothetical protein [Actinomadura rudentiformis]|uniref:hypothetical protein n=1 Tax=Actinomadura rudentiformis TaxID=359158 RepID=UPI001CEF7865|nr:hypothetical protein [Actinomadura rudentiformis]